MLCPDEDDEIMAEVRRMRDEFAAQFGYDDKTMWEYLRRHAEQFPHKYVCLNPKDPNYVGDDWRYEDFFKRPQNMPLDTEE